MQLKLAIPGSHVRDEAWHAQNVAVKIDLLMTLLGYLDPDCWFHVYVSVAGKKNICDENLSSGRSGTWVRRSDGKKISHAEWNAPGHVLQMIILGEWNTDEDCHLYVTSPRKQESLEAVVATTGSSRTMQDSQPEERRSRTKRKAQFHRRSVN